MKDGRIDDLTKRREHARMLVEKADEAGIVLFDGFDFHRSSIEELDREFEELMKEHGKD